MASLLFFSKVEEVKAVDVSRLVVFYFQFGKSSNSNMSSNAMLKNFQRRRLTVVEQGSLGDHGEELEGDLHLHVRLVRRKGEKKPLIKR